jgi:hypothetical protein
MNYLTNYYKNLSEQLQEQVNQLEALLAEAKKGVDKKTGKTVETRKIEVVDFDPYTGEDMPIIMGQYADGRGKGAQKTRQVKFYPGYAFTDMSREEEEAYARDLDANQPLYSRDENPLARSMYKTGEALTVRADEVRHGEVRERKGGSVPGTGKKARDKRIAIALAKPQNKQAENG